MTQLLTKSNNFTSEYCCSIIKIGDCFPIEGKDRIQRTIVNGENVVISKSITSGTILFYASNETQLNKDFLSANNLFESSCCELNSNFSVVERFINKNKELKFELDDLVKITNKLTNCINFLMTYEADLRSNIDNKEAKDELDERYDRTCNTIIKLINNDHTLDIKKSSQNDFIVAAQRDLTTRNHEIDDLKNEIEYNTNFIKSHVGFFNKTGRVRAIKLGGVRSMGYLFSIDELAKYNPKVKDINLEELVGEDFDTVDGELFVKAYVPFVPERKQRTKSEKRNKIVERFDRMIKGEFAFHYDTQMFARCVNLFKPTDVVVISNKLHGTSFICGKVHVKKPIKLPFHKWLLNKFIDFTHLFKSHRIIDYVVEYGNVTSSRTVIKNQYINKDVSDGFYGKDIWSEYGEMIYPYLDEGMIVYGEICGYVTDSDKLIQKGYDYGCEIGENFLMPYRITTTNEDGTKKEWNCMDVKEWTEKLISEHPELSQRIKPLVVFYHGTLADLYPNLSLTEHWHENLLEEMRNDTKHFGMEKNEPLCVNKVPREGIVIRKDDDEFAEAFKLKCYKFLKAEANLMDDIANGKADISEEMAEVYS